jgi:RecB family endonuclease NucS
VALHSIERSRNKLQVILPSSFTDEQWLERHHLQPLIRDNPQAIDPALFIVAEEFNSWEGSGRRIDLLGLDKEGNLVVIELKRIDEGGHMELQSIRYAAMLSTMDFEEVF